MFHGQKFEFFKVSRATFVLGFFTGKVLVFTGKKKNTARSEVKFRFRNLEAFIKDKT